MSNAVLLTNKKKQYDLFDLVTRASDPDIDRIYYRAMKKAAKEQNKVLKEARKISKK